MLSSWLCKDRPAVVKTKAVALPLTNKVLRIEPEQCGVRIETSVMGSYIMNYLPSWWPVSILTNHPTWLGRPGIRLMVPGEPEWAPGPDFVKGSCHFCLAGSQGALRLKQGDGRSVANVYITLHAAHLLLVHVLLHYSP